MKLTRIFSLVLHIQLICIDSIILAYSICMNVWLHENYDCIMFSYSIEVHSEFMWTTEAPCTHNTIVM